MDICSYANPNELTEALDTVCMYCISRKCSCCEVSALRLRSGSLEYSSEHELDLPDIFAFQTQVNTFTSNETYYARRMGDQYIVFLPRIDCMYHFSVERMWACILQKRFVLTASDEEELKKAALYCKQHSRWLDYKEEKMERFL